MTTTETPTKPAPPKKRDPNAPKKEYKKSFKKKNNINYKCVAWLHGRLAAGKDANGTRRLFFRCSDGTIFRVIDLGRSDNAFVVGVLF